MSPDPYDGSYDPSNPQTLNRYAYVQNQPLNSVDPSGLESLQMCAGQDGVPCDSLGTAGTPGFTLTLITILWPLPTFPLSWFTTTSNLSLRQVPGGDYKTPPSEGACNSGGNAPTLTQYQAAGQAAANSMVSPNGLQKVVGFKFNFANLPSFHRGGAFDAQAFGGSTSYANYGYGVYMASAGYSLSQTLQGANLYAGVIGRYKADVPRSNPQYPSTPDVNITNIFNGFKNQQAGAFVCPP